MSRVCIEKDERWPDYSLIGSGHSCYDERDAVEVDDDLVRRWLEVSVAYDAIQDEIEALRGR